MKGAPAAEAVARSILAERTGKFHFEHTDPNEVLFALRAEYPGHLIPGLLEERQRMIDEEIERVKVTLAHIVRIVGLAELELEGGP